MSLRLLTAVLLSIWMYSNVSAANSSSSPAHPEKSVVSAKHPQAKEISPKKPSVPDDYTLNMMIRSTIIAVSQANRTGNYSVLRDLGSPGFQRANTEAKLAEIFAAQRNAKLDFSPVLFFKPNLVRKPEVDSNGMLRLTGYFSTQPAMISFDLAFEWVDSGWEHVGVSVSTRRSPTALPAH